MAMVLGVWKTAILMEERTDSRSEKEMASPRASTLEMKMAEAKDGQRGESTVRCWAGLSEEQ